MSPQNETDRKDCYTGTSRANQFKTAGHHAIPRIGGHSSGDFSPFTDVKLYAAVVCRRASRLVSFPHPCVSKVQRRIVG